MEVVETVAGTRQTRVKADLAIKLAAIKRWDGVASSDFLDPHIRGPIDAAFNAIPAGFRAKFADELAEA